MNNAVICFMNARATKMCVQFMCECWLLHHDSFGNWSTDYQCKSWMYMLGVNKCIPLYRGIEIASFQHHWFTRLKYNMDIIIMMFFRTLTRYYWSILKDCKSITVQNSVCANKYNNTILLNVYNSFASEHVYFY